MGFALSMGLLGGVLPAACAARLNIVDALRAAEQPGEVSFTSVYEPRFSCARGLLGGSIVPI
jgi:hypothetical protein